MSSSVPLATERELTDRRNTVPVTPPAIVSKPEWVIRMPRTSRPRCVHERIVKILLHFVDEPLREPRILVDKAATMFCEMVDDRFMTGSHSCPYIGFQGTRRALDREF
jgi:hypothetical protein